MSVVREVEKPKTKQELVAEKYAHLVGQGITISEAAEKYGVPRSAVTDWVYRTNDVSFVDQTSYPKLVSEADVAVCADIYRDRKRLGLTGLPYFDKDGFQIENVKHPGLSAKRRRGRQKQAA